MRSDLGDYTTKAELAVQSDKLLDYALKGENTYQVKGDYAVNSSLAEYALKTDLTKRTCRDLSTPYDEDGNGDYMYLDRHFIQCGDDENITNMRLVRDVPNKKIKYDYRCCKTG